MKTKSEKTIKVTRCSNCPFRDNENYCGLYYHLHNKVLSVVDEYYDKSRPKDCPLKQTNITVK